MGEAGVRNSTFADLLKNAVDADSVSAIWSEFSAAGHTAADTLRGAAPEYTPPEISIKSVAYPHDDDSIADYAITGRLGEGGMGVVFEARQRSLNRLVALKMIRPERGGDPVARNSFFYEAAITAGLEHPGIVPILDFGLSQEGRAFYTMKKATGKPWSRVIRENSLAENLGIFDRVADVISYAHSQGVIHRDLKPANVLLGDYGELWVSDWGVAVRQRGAGDFSHAHPGGTPRYMPPEMVLLDANRQGPASDVYMLGAILFEIIAGQPPHKGNTVAEAVGDALAGQPPCVDAQPMLYAIAQKAMAELPVQRYQTVREMQEVIRDAVSSNESTALSRRADLQLAEAMRTGGYDLFQLAIADYTTALEAYPRNEIAKAGRVRALLAYSKQALSKREYDLALSILEPLLPADTEAAVLAETIEREKKAARRRPRRYSIVNTFLGVFALVLLAGGAYVYFNWGNLAYNTYRSRSRSDSSYYNDIHKELTQLTGSLRAAEHNARRRDETALLNAIHGAMSVLDDCERQFIAPEQATPSVIRRLCGHLFGRLPEVEEHLEQIRKCAAELPEGSQKRTLLYTGDRHAKMVELLNLYLRSESE